MTDRIEETRISIAGMSCMRCASKVEQALNGRSGVMGASASLAR